MEHPETDTIRIPPVELAEHPWLREALAAIMPPGVPPLLLFRTLARNRRVFERMMAGALLDRGTLSLREREIVINRTCARCDAWYEFDVHVAFFGAKIGLNEAQIANLKDPIRDHDTWNARESLLLDAVDALHDHIDIPDGLWAKLSSEFTQEQVLEILALAGYYRTISILVRTLRLPKEPFTRASA